jgi:hypothetical protein
MRPMGSTADDKLEERGAHGQDMHNHQDPLRMCR